MKILRKIQKMQLDIEESTPVSACNYSIPKKKHNLVYCAEVSHCQLAYFMRYELFSSLNFGAMSNDRYISDIDLYRL